MAIWQFELYLIPKSALVKKYGHIPENLHINQDGWNKYFEESNLDEVYDFEDALTIYWWKYLKVLTVDLFPLLENIAEFQQRMPGLQPFGDVDGNNISVCYDEKTDEVEELSCRLDLSKVDKIFINNIFSIAAKFDCLLMNKQGALIQPEMKELLDIIKSSNSYRFVSDPEKFFNDLSSGSITPE